MCDVSWTTSQLPPAHQGQEACMLRMSQPEAFLTTSFSCLQSSEGEGLSKVTQLATAKSSAVAGTGCGHGKDCTSMWEQGG